MVECGSRLQKVAENGVYIVTVRFTLLIQKTETVTHLNGTVRMTNSDALL